LPKIHKQGHPLRIIISTVNNPFYNLGCFLHHLINASISASDSQVTNSFHLVSKLNGMVLDSNYKLASLDVESLFTNVPTDKATDSIFKRWNLISNNISIPHNKFITVVSLILNSTVFKFNDNHYKQIFGTPMGFPLSPI